MVCAGTKLPLVRGALGISLSGVDDLLESPRAWRMPPTLDAVIDGFEGAASALPAAVLDCELGLDPGQLWSASTLETVAIEFSVFSSSGIGLSDGASSVPSRSPVVSAEASLVSSADLLLLFIECITANVPRQINNPTAQMRSIMDLVMRGRRPDMTGSYQSNELRATPRDCQSAQSVGASAGDIANRAFT